MNALVSASVPWIVRAATVTLLLASKSAFATADGPDFFQVTGVASDDMLNIREEPNPHAKKVGTIPADGDCVRNLGCQGGLTLREFSNLSESQKAVRLKENPRWCKVEHQGTTGWVAGRYLREGACDAPVTDAAADLSRLIGIRARDGEAELQRQGYRFKGGRKDKDRSFTFYKAPGEARCLQVVTRDGRYQSLDDVDESECRKAATAAVTAGARLNAKPGADSFQTVCGVFVDSKSYRYLCQVTEVTGDKGIERTALRFPDNELQLIWRDNSRVDVQPEGLTPIPATYSVSEGETNISLENKTYFYYADRGLAAMEVKHFKP